MTQMYYSVLGGNTRTVEIIPDDPTQPPYSMATSYVNQTIADGVFYKRYTLRNFIQNYRFSSYGERYFDDS